MQAPNPAVAGRGFKHLRAAGIEVVTGLREAEARRLAEAFAKWIVSRQPLVTLKSALTLDGQLVLPYARGRARPPLRARAALADRHLEDRWISSPQPPPDLQRIPHPSA